MNRLTFLIIILVVSYHILLPQDHYDVVVDWQGTGDYKTISEAVDALSMYPYQRTVIFIKKGVYEEKIRIEKNYITLKGESRDSTIIRYNLPREAWNKNKDYLGPGVVNIEGDDCILDNLTIENSQPVIGPHAFAVYGLNPNRVIIINCNVLSKGGDTVSLWNYKEGMYYHANCFFEGAVDFVCPRGWCFIRDSKFYEVKKTAAIWHAGNYSPDQKFVLQNCSFDGVKGFDLGRHHYEAQFYLLDCTFSENMSDKPIYKVYDKNPDRNNPYYGGERKYFFNCQKDGQTYNWYKNNLDQAPGNPKPEDIAAAWTFQNQWEPELKSPIKITSYVINDHSIILEFDEIVTVRDIPIFENSEGKQFKIKVMRFNDINRLSFTSETPITKSDLIGEMKLIQGDIIASMAYIQIRSIGKKFNIILN
ncbi:MAG: pectinesterase family protein [Calditrichaceae bacterium]